MQKLHINTTTSLFGKYQKSIQWIFPVIILLSQLFSPCLAQELKPHGKFLVDSAKIGLPIRYTLSFRHPAEMQVIFPDSGYNFSPFEWDHKDYFPTRTDAKGSIDSVVYTFTTFNIAPIQKLQLPVYIVQQKDCTTVYATIDSVVVQQLLGQPSRFLSPKTNVEYIPVPQTLDYRLILAIILASGLLILLLYLLFGRQIKRQYRLYRLWREHRSFVSHYEKLRRKVRQQKETSAVEMTVVLWKQYMELLHNKPYSSYTTKEITEIISNSKLSDSLQIADRAIYGNSMPEEIYGALRNLQMTAESFYKRKRVEVASKR
ncbi:hypothetical protein QNI19_28545 [Cytophagaceae bacterium DM2B3-1]|uniref:Protein BatD n=1 Tax=Xanthocytophaga flava TaxID=3048013 RepID=A0ABT7CT45_9BACT|nr:hypothetical protein [Xanthocytophaga flavus]MDJ1471449.1 hypothetical protein [Xanthocytophaga flavus]MDJ1496919.1 hypothetical protein [Xanthocytophaga flavus]